MTDKSHSLIIFGTLSGSDSKPAAGNKKTGARKGTKKEPANEVEQTDKMDAEDEQSSAVTKTDNSDADKPKDEGTLLNTRALRGIEIQMIVEWP